MREIIQISVNRFLIGQAKNQKRGFLTIVALSMRQRGSSRKQGDPWITISMGGRLRRYSNPVYRLLSASSFFETESALYDRVMAGASPNLFLFFLTSSFFFFSSRVHRFRAALQAHKQLSARIGPALAEYWLTHRIRYKNGPTMRATLMCEIRRII